MMISDPAAIERTRAAFELLLPRRRTDLTVSAAPTDLQLIDDRLRTALLEWLLAACRQPLALLLEDVHWTDGASLALLEALLEHAFARPLIVIATARPELADARPDLFAGNEVVRIDLRGLARAAVRRVAESAAGRPLDDALIDRVAARSEGNPFFVEQIVHTLEPDTGLEGELRVPLTVEAAIQSRLDHLPRSEKDLCKLASVIGRAFSVAELVGLGAREPRIALRPLRRRGLIAARGDDRFDFANALYRDVAYRMLSLRAQLELHARAAQLLEESANADLEEIAQHLEKAGDVRAAPYYARAACGAMLRGDAQTVLRASEAALRLGIDDAMQYEVRMARADALRFLGRREEQSAELDVALAHATTDAERARALSEQCVCAARKGRGDEALALGEAAVEAARAASQPDALVLALGRHLLALVSLGRFGQARGRLEEAEAVLHVEPRTLAQLAEWRGQLASALGDLSARRQAFTRAAELHRQLGDLRRAAGAECNLADVDNRIGAYVEAARALEDACGACQKVGHRAMEGYARLNLGYALTMMGRPNDALPVLEAAGQIAERIEEVRLSLLVRIYRARALLAIDRAEETMALASDAAREARERAMPALEIAARTVLGRALVQRGLSEAFAETSRAMELLEAVGGVEEDEIETYLAHADAARVRGDPVLADSIRKRARARLCELADRIDDAPLRESFLHNVPAHRSLEGG
jgi:tetratricopeptide (TPR) repeat protein